MIYVIAWVIGDFLNFFSLNNKKRDFSKEQLLNLNKDITDPDISIDGLKERLDSLRFLDLSFLCFGVILSSILTFIAGVVLSLSPSWIAIFSSIGFYFVATAVVLSFRSQAAKNDLKKYKNKTNDFIINRKAEPSLYDLIPGIFVSICFYFFLMNFT